MANAWGNNPIALDTANGATAYAAADDARLGTGTKYHSGRFKIKAIHIYGAANGDTIKINQFKDTAGVLSIDGTDIINTVVETGDLNKTFEFPGGLWVNGIIPTTLSNSSKVRIFLE